MRFIFLIASFVAVAACSSTPEYRPPATHYATGFNDAAFGRPRPGRQNSGQDVVVETEDGTLVRIDAATRSAQAEYQRLTATERQMAYEDGVRDTMEEFAGRMRARQGFVWQEPVMERVWMPGGVRNGAFVPGHYETVLISPGRWLEANGILLPEDDLSGAPRPGHTEGYDDGR